MLQTLLGRDNFRKGMDLYDRQRRRGGDRRAVRACFADASGTDLGQFMRWYSQAGTPAVVAAASPLRRAPGPIASSWCRTCRRRRASRRRS
jgi:aminopeptidase N